MNIITLTRNTNLKTKQILKTPQHLHFPSGKILELSDVPLAKYDFDLDQFKANE
jgi:hypothetical protein